ncbi:MAG: hypothetical protein IPP74_10095 [Alphaproteobacteria bacterium]|nr:hypothetical protein [Alphaproteobacteria bacterium]
MQDQYFQWGVALFLITITWFVSEIWKHSNQIKGGISRLAALNKRSPFILYLKPINPKLEQVGWFNPTLDNDNSVISGNFIVYLNNYALDQRQLLGYANNIAGAQGLAKNHEMNNPGNPNVGYYAVPTDDFTAYIQGLCDKDQRLGAYIYALAGKDILGQCARIDL